MRLPRLFSLAWVQARPSHRLNTLLGSNKDADYRIAHIERQRFAPLFIGIKLRLGQSSAMHVSQPAISRGPCR